MYDVVQKHPEEGGGMNAEFREWITVLNERPEIADLIRIILDSPKDQRGEMIKAAIDFLNNQRGGRKHEPI